MDHAEGNDRFSSLGFRPRTWRRRRRVAASAGLAVATICSVGTGRALFRVVPNIDAAFSVLRLAVMETHRERVFMNTADKDADARRLAAEDLQNSGDSNLTSLLEMQPQKVVRKAGTIQGPAWASCFVEYGEDHNVLEEWLLRGNKADVAAFRTWRKSAVGLSSTMSFRCLDSSPLVVDNDVACLECLTTAGVALSTHGDAAVDTSPMDCFAQSLGGSGFCRVGTVTVPA